MHHSAIIKHSKHRMSLVMMTCITAWQLNIWVFFLFHDHCSYQFWNKYCMYFVIFDFPCVLRWNFKICLLSSIVVKMGKITPMSVAHWTWSLKGFLLNSSASFLCLYSFTQLFYIKSWKIHSQAAFLVNTEKARKAWSSLQVSLVDLFSSETAPNILYSHKATQERLQNILE